MSPAEINQLYGLAHKLARSYRPFWLDYEDAIQEYVVAGWQATTSDHNTGGNERIHWGYVYKSMFNRGFCNLMRQRQTDTEGAIIIERTNHFDSNEQQNDKCQVCESEITYDVLIPMPESGEIKETLLALATFPTVAACRQHLGVCRNRWLYRVSQARQYVEDNMA